MSGRYLTDLAQVCRNAGLTTLEQDGWQTRARSSGGYASGRPTHVMVHHTASGPSSDGWPDANYCSYSSDARPVANLYLDRQGTVYVLAAGATNTNGQGHDNWGGGVPDDSMNTYAIGIEAGNNGTGENWASAQQSAYVRLVSALCSHYGINTNHARAHFEWAPDRKIDPAGPSQWSNPSGGGGGNQWRMNDFRADLTGGSLPPPLPGGDTSMLILCIITDARTPAAQYVSNGLFYRHVTSTAALDALKLFMGIAGHDTKVNQVTKAQANALGAYVQDNGSTGGANPYL